MLSGYVAGIVGAPGAEAEDRVKRWNHGAGVARAQRVSSVRLGRPRNSDLPSHEGSVPDPEPFATHPAG